MSAFSGVTPFFRATFMGFSLFFRATFVGLAPSFQTTFISFTPLIPSPTMSEYRAARPGKQQSHRERKRSDAPPQVPMHDFFPFSSFKRRHFSVPHFSVSASEWPKR